MRDTRGALGRSAVARKALFVQLRNSDTGKPKIALQSHLLGIGRLCYKLSRGWQLTQVVDGQDSS